MHQLKKYISEVLGVKEILVSASLDAKVPRLIFLDEKGIRTSAGQELLEKMIASMKLAPDEYKVLEIDLNEISENLQLFEAAQVMICFSKTLSDFIQNNFPRVNLKSTFGPEDLLNKPELKRQVWELFKSLM